MFLAVLFPVVAVTRANDRWPIQTMQRRRPMETPRPIKWQIRCVKTLTGAGCGMGLLENAPVLEDVLPRRSTELTPRVP